VGGLKTGSGERKRRRMRNCSSGARRVCVFLHAVDAALHSNSGRSPTSSVMLYLGKLDDAEPLQAR